MSIGKSKNKKERKKINDDMVPMWRNWSVATLIATLQLLDIYKLMPKANQKHLAKFQTVRTEKKSAIEKLQYGKCKL